MLRDVKTVRGSHGRGGDRRDAAPACCASAGHTAREAPRRPAPKPAPLGAGEVGCTGTGNPRITSEPSASFGDLSGSFRISQYWQKDFQ